jgi:DNA polymerase I
MKHIELEFGDCGAHIVAFTRDSNGKRIKTKIQFDHYFYVPDPEGKYKSIFGDRLRKRTIKKFWEAKKAAQAYDMTFEADLGYTKRFLADRGHTIKSEYEPRKMFWDIETTSLDPGEGQVISIVAYDSYNKVYYEFIHGPELECETERQMLLKFARFVKKIEPDIISGWNCSKFDWQFLLSRMEYNNIPLGILSPMGKVDRYHTNQGEQIRVRGLALIDMLEAYKKMSYSELESYRLDYVAFKELGIGKNEISKLPGKLWDEQDYHTLLLYNRRDVEILVELDEKLEILKFLNTVSEIASIDIQETLYNSRIVDAYILKYTTSKGIILPTKDFSRKSSGYKGATVLDPRKGIHKNVGVYDLASLYPSIIITFNLSPETMGTGTSNKGLIPTLLEDLFILRKDYRSKGLDNEQRVIKEIMNSFYGVMAFPSFRLYTPAMAAEITTHGREIIEHTKNVVIDSGFNVIYGDTDSVFVSGLHDMDAAKDLETKINSRYTEYALTHNLAEHRLHIEFEKFASTAIMVAKKRYALKLGDKYVVKGFQMVRSDTQKLTRELQETIIHMILDGASNKEISKLFHDTKALVLRGEKTEDIGIPRKFTKKLDEYANNAAVRGAQYSNKVFEKNYGAGDKVVFYHIKQTTNIKYPATDALAIEYGDDIPSGFIINVKKHWERINKAIVPLLNEIGALEKEKQMSLGDFL